MTRVENFSELNTKNSVGNSDKKVDFFGHIYWNFRINSEKLGNFRKHLELYYLLNLLLYKVMNISKKLNSYKIIETNDI